MVLGEEEIEESDQRSSWNGKSVEQLVAALCVLGSGGQLNVSTPVVDDDGVDLVFNLRGNPAMLVVQVKSRFASSKQVREHGGFAAGIRRATFHARPELALLFVLYDDVERQDITAVWLVPATEFARLTANQSSTRSTLRLALSLAGNNNQWTPFRCDRRGLPRRIVEMLQQLNTNGGGE